MAEAGFPDYDLTPWIGLVVPSGTPRQIVDKLAGAVRAATRDKTVALRLNNLGVTPNGNSPAEFRADFKSAIALWGDVVRSIGMGRKE